MSPFRRNPESRVRKALAVMSAEYAADEAEGRGLYNRPRYVAAQRSIRELGQNATEPLLEHLGRLEHAKRSTRERSLADDIVQLLGDSRDARAVPKLATLLPGIWPSLVTALAKTDEGTQVLLDAARSPDRHLRSEAMIGMSSSDHRRTEVAEALLAGLRDTETRVRDQAVMGIMNRGQADQPIITALLSIRSSDDDQRLRERADSALRRIGVL